MGSGEGGQGRDIQVRLLQGRPEGVFGCKSVSGGPQRPGSLAGVEALGIGAGRGADENGEHEPPAVVEGSEPGVGSGVRAGLRLLQPWTSTTTL